MRYALKKIRKITLKDIETGENKAILSDLKTATLTGNSETVWADGSDGTHLVGFDINKVASLTAENGSIEIGYIETQTGGKIKSVKNGTNILFSEVITIQTADTAKLTNKPSGVEGEEIKFVYSVDSTHSPDRENVYKQTKEANLNENEFKYDSSTNTITLPTGKFPIGSKIYVEYFPTFKNYSELNNNSDEFSEMCSVYVDAWFTDICTKKDIPLQLVLPSGKVSGEINLQFGDQAAVQSLNIEAMASCGEKALWKLYKYNMDEVLNA